MDEGDSVTVEVAVNNRYWARVPSLLDAGPDDTVYSLNTQTGNVIFGDGVEGAVPPVGSNIVVSYRYGAGLAGHISRTIECAGDLAKFWVIVRDELQASGWGDRLQ